MTSKALQVVNDTPGLFASVDGNSFFDMPTGDTTGENSHWIPNVYDVKGDNINVKLKSLTSDRILDTSLPSSSFTKFNNKDKLFSSYIPNTNQDQRFSFSAEFDQTSKGEKWIYLGSPYKSQLLTRKARWTVSLGTQFTIKSYSDTKLVNFDQIHLVYYKEGEDSLYYSTLRQNTLVKITEDYKRYYGYVSKEAEEIILSQNLVTVGAVMDFHTRGSGFVNIYDFKLLRSRKFRTKRSLLIVPSPHLIGDRQRMKSVPIV